MANETVFGQLQSQIDRFDRLVQSVEQRVESFPLDDRRAAEWQRVVQSVGRHADEVASMVTDGRGLVVALAAKSNELDETIAEQTEELHQEREELEQLRREVDSGKAHLEELKLNAVSSIDEVATRLTDLDMSIDEKLAGLREDLGASSKTILEQLERYRSELSGAKRELGQLLTNNASLRRSSDELKSANQSLQRQLDESESTVESLRRELNQVKSAGAEAQARSQAQNQALSVLFDAEREDLETAREAQEELRARLSHAMLTSDILVAEKTDLVEEKRLLEEKLTALEEKLTAQQNGAKVASEPPELESQEQVRDAPNKTPVTKPSAVNGFLDSPRPRPGMALPRQWSPTPLPYEHAAKLFAAARASASKDSPIPAKSLLFGTTSRKTEQSGEQQGIGDLHEGGMVHVEAEGDELASCANLDNAKPATIHKDDHKELTLDFPAKLPWRSANLPMPPSYEAACHALMRDLENFRPVFVNASDLNAEDIVRNAAMGFLFQRDHTLEFVHHGPVGPEDWRCFTGVYHYGHADPRVAAGQCFCSNEACLSVRRHDLPARYNVICTLRHL